MSVAPIADTDRAALRDGGRDGDEGRPVNVGMVEGVIRRRALRALDSDERRDRELVELRWRLRDAVHDRAAAVRVAARLRVLVEQHEQHLAAGNEPTQWARWRAVVECAVETLEGQPFIRRAVRADCRASVRRSKTPG